MKVRSDDVAVRHLFPADLQSWKRLQQNITRFLRSMFLAFPICSTDFRHRAPGRALLGGEWP